METLIVILILVIVFHVVYPIIYLIVISNDLKYELVSNLSEIINPSITSIVSFVTLFIICKNLKEIQKQNNHIAEQIRLSTVSTQIESLKAYKENHINEGFNYESYKKNTLANRILNSLTEEFMKSKCYVEFDKPYFTLNSDNGKYHNILVLDLNGAPIKMPIEQIPNFGIINQNLNYSELMIGKNIFVPIKISENSDHFYKVEFTLIYTSLFSQTKWMQKFVYYPKAIETDQTQKLDLFEPELFNA